jgi:hypothetical protein
MPRRTVSSSNLYPIVQDLTLEEYTDCCCDQQHACGKLSSSLREWIHNPGPTQDSTNAKRANRLSRARNAKALLDVCNSLTFSEGDDARREEPTSFNDAYVLTRQVSLCRCCCCVWMWLAAHVPFYINVTDLSMCQITSLGMRSSNFRPAILC